METYLNAGYFIVKTKAINFGSDLHRVVETCSGCINFAVFDYWCLSWTSDELGEKEKNELKLTDEKIDQIQTWTDELFDKKIITWGNALPSLEIALTFKNLFFADQDEINIYTIYFSEPDANALIAGFEGEQYNHGDFALRHNLLNRIEEVDSEDELFVGYDFIGVELEGSFHSFYCHDMTGMLINTFNLKLNQFGLFDTLPDSQAISDYLNGPESGVEPVPWYIVKTKRIKAVQ
jgi:hypothetical protein